MWRTWLPLAVHARSESGLVRGLKGRKGETRISNRRNEQLEVMVHKRYDGGKSASGLQFHGTGIVKGVVPCAARRGIEYKYATRKERERRRHEGWLSRMVEWEMKGERWVTW